MPALLGHITFAADNPWFWKHLGSQFAMGMASPFLSAYALVTLHHVSEFMFMPVAMCWFTI
jgi:hypothetical protein